MGLPNPRHSHWDPHTHQFVQHEHVHAGPHKHVGVGRGLITVNEPGNYAPGKDVDDEGA